MFPRCSCRTLDSLTLSAQRWRPTGCRAYTWSWRSLNQSLRYLERLPLDRIKIDRSYVRQLSEPRSARIAEMVAQLGRKLGLSVLAEGIEDATVWNALVGMDCQEGQGYHIAMPMEAHELVAWVQRDMEQRRALVPKSG